MDNLDKFVDELERDEPVKFLDPTDKKHKYQIYKGKLALEKYKEIKKEYGEGITTGYSKTNEYFRFLPGQLYLLSAPTHQGKTMLSLNMCSYIALTGKKVLFISLEQGVFVAKLVTKILDGIYPETLSVLDTSKMLTVKELLQALKESGKWDLVCLDHLHFLKKGGKGATEDIGEIIHELQNLAKELEVPVFAIAHLRKLNKKTAPVLDDLRDSSSLAQVPSVVMMLYRTEVNNSLADEGLLFIRKNRIQGKTGAIKFYIKEKVKIVFDETPLPKEPKIVEKARDIFS